MPYRTHTQESNADVLIVGAGISGIDAAYRIQEAFPNCSYTILDAREVLDGTRSLFHYPGIRSDPDLYTLGFPWDPRAEKSVEWRSESQRWTVNAVVHGTERKTFVSKFILIGTGLFDYDEGLKSPIPGLENFQETRCDRENAAAIPGDRAAFVTLLQRSPSYLYTVPKDNPVDGLIRGLCPTRWSHSAVRWKYILGFMVFYNFSTMFPNLAKKFIRKSVETQLPANVPFDPHFVPAYRPWDQRMLVTHQGDVFAALRTGKADIATDHIKPVDKTSIVLRSGARLVTNIIVTATGLKVLMFGKIRIVVDGQPVDFSDKFTWKGAGLQDLPNLFFVFGYTNASWTLGADTTCQLFVRLVREMHKRGVQSFVPTIETPGSVKEEPWLNLSSTYIVQARKERRLPKAGDIKPWTRRSSYLSDWVPLKLGADVTAGLRFGPPSHASDKKALWDDERGERVPLLK